MRLTLLVLVAAVAFVQAQKPPVRGGVCEIPAAGEIWLGTSSKGDSIRFVFDHGNVVGERHVKKDGTERVSYFISMTWMGLESVSIWDIDGLEPTNPVSNPWDLCDRSYTAVYHATWSIDCNEVTLVSVQDRCSRREARWGSQLKLRPHPPVCNTPTEGQIWKAQGPEGPLTFTWTGGLGLIEYQRCDKCGSGSSTERGVYTLAQRWMENENNERFEVIDINSVDLRPGMDKLRFDDECARIPGQLAGHYFNAIYRVEWSRDCARMKWIANTEPCLRRPKQWGDVLTLLPESAAPQECPEVHCPETGAQAPIDFNFNIVKREEPENGCLKH